MSARRNVVGGYGMLQLNNSISFVYILPFDGHPKMQVWMELKNEGVIFM
jgi:hypothetical protein